MVARSNLNGKIFYDENEDCWKSEKTGQKIITGYFIKQITFLVQFKNIISKILGK